MFRKEALEKLSSPDELDQMLVIVGRKGWIALAAGGGLSVVLLLWAIVGAVPVTVDGMGVLISPGYVKPIQSKTHGMVAELRVRPGTVVKEGDILAVLSVPETRQQLAQARSVRTEVVRVNEETLKLDTSRVDLQVESIKVQSKLVRKEIKKAERLRRKLVRQTRVYNSTQKKNLERTRTLSKELNESLKKRYGAAEKLRKDGLASEQMVLIARTNLIENKRKLADLAVRLEELRLSEIRSRQSELATQNRIADLRLKLLDLQINRKKLEQDKLRSAYALESEVRLVSDKESNLALQLDEAMYIRSPYSGRVIEVSVSFGQYIQPTHQIAVVELDADDKKLKGLVYFPVKDGKKIGNGMIMQITPSIVERERYGSMQSTVVRVSEYPISRAAAATILGSAEFALAITGSTPVIEVEAELLKDPDTKSGYAWSSKGPDLKLTPGTTITCRVTVERRSPISYVLPVLRTLFAGKDG